MADKSNNLQDVFLNAVRKTKTPVTMFLVYWTWPGVSVMMNFLFGVSK